MFNPTKSEREWLARFTKHVRATSGEHFDAVVHGAALLSAALGGSSDVQKIAASPAGAIVTPYAGRLVSVSEQRVVFEFDAISIASASGIIIGTTPLREHGTVQFVTSVLSVPGQTHVTVMLGSAIVLQVPRDDDHYTALANIANGAQVVIPSLSVKTIGWSKPAFHRFRACVIEHLVRKEERLS